MKKLLELADIEALKRQSVRFAQSAIDQAQRNLEKAQGELVEATQARRDHESALGLDGAARTTSALVLADLIDLLTGAEDCK
ncbi:hypothetical protein [Burkholderia stagnalis]|uniref:hypothetical protein n=1 Tax=Burkholderia stagnalis TaxID=1503054 RepID=UPI000F58B9CA|nr:hypothetical protein [Burkholderia stagnalis]RQQ55637.1 hypothetical protein DF162_01670 [Burkholderia stagnalis]RQY19098.1 hypothetical protein DF118_01675 [Burkholderia stagnalis]RQY92041.1 hypothetical protein DF108_01675 [Burkholderia stagnalis]